MLLLQLISLFEKEGIEHLVSGGYALCLNGAVRPTLDIDILIPSNTSALHKVEWCLNEIDMTYHPENSDSLKKVFIKKPIESIVIHIDTLFHSYRSKTIKAHSHMLEILHPEDLMLIKSQQDTLQNQQDVLALKMILQQSRNA